MFIIPYLLILIAKANNIVIPPMVEKIVAIGAIAEVVLYILVIIVQVVAMIYHFRNRL